MLRRRLKVLIRAAFLGVALSSPAMLVADEQDFWFNATSDPAVVPADFITYDARQDSVMQVTFVPQMQPFDDRVSSGLGIASIDPGSSFGDPGTAFESTATTFAAPTPVVPATDATQLIQDSSQGRGVNIQRRSAGSFDPRVRGFRSGEVYTQADNIFFVPLRPDLDTVLSKTDPSMITGINVIKGPYSAQFGPSFSFIDVTTMGTPRYYDGYEAHATTGYTVQTNGSRQLGRQSVYGGDADYGYAINYGYRNGIDYASGSEAAGSDIPGSYLFNTVGAQFGFDLSSDKRIEMRYQHLDQGHTQYPGQFFDVDSLQTDLYAVSYIDEGPCNPWTQFYLGGYYHRTPMYGSLSSDNYYFRIPQRIQSALAEEGFGGGNPNAVEFNARTNGQIEQTGAKAMFTFGEEQDAQLRTGTDLRFYRQRLVENLGVTDISNPAFNFVQNTQLPESQLTNPGAFAELSLPMLEYWTMRVGGRVDYNYTTAYYDRALISPTNAGGPFFNTPSNGFDNLRQGDVLYSFYAMNDIEINSNYTVNVGFGQAQRAPTLIERYADGVFISVLQSGFTRVLGDQNLDPSRNWQFDVNLSADYESTRGSIGGFYAIVQDYITYRGLSAVDPLGARLVRYINTPQATLMGAEAYGEHDLSDMLTLFGAAQYLRGTDDEFHIPLTGISPFDSRLGLRLHDADGGKRWGTELAARGVLPQNRVGYLQIGTTETTSVAPIEMRTPGFVTFDLRGYWSPRPNLTFTGGIENLTNKAFYEHLDLRLPNDPVTVNGVNYVIPAAFAYTPGITPYVGMEWTY